MDFIWDCSSWSHTFKGTDSKIPDLAQEVGDIAQEVSDIAQEVGNLAQEVGNLAQEMQISKCFWTTLQIWLFCSVLTELTNSFAQC